MPFNYPNQIPVDFINPQPLNGQTIHDSSFPDKVDVLIVGAGPAGLMAANALSSFGINVRIIDQRPASIVAGQADGIQPRTTEVLQSYGLANRLLREGNQLWEISFWNPGSRGTIERSERIPDVTTPTARYPFEVTLHQGAIENIFIDAMSTRGLIVDRPTTVHDWAILSSTEAQNGYRIKITLGHLTEPKHIKLSQFPSNNTDPKKENEQNGYVKETIVYAKYVIGCDGAHSWVRKKLGFTLNGEQTNYVWGVIDSHLQTDFPDIRNRSTIHSHYGTCMVIPREGDRVRLYIQLANVEKDDSNERMDRSKITPKMLMDSARQIFSPYKLNWPDVEWWTIYIVSQRYASYFADENERIFIAGDACHTHSPKAGQGMNASMNDTHNLAWKLAMVIKGLAYPSILKTYEFERRNYAKQLIEFDRTFAKLFADKPVQSTDEVGVTHEEFRSVLQMFNGFTSGLAVMYEPSLITGRVSENQSLAEGLPIGKSLMSQVVVRHVDARPFHMHDQMPTDLRFRVLIFAGDCLLPAQLAKIEEAAKALQALAKRYTPPSGNYDDVIDFITVSSNPHAEYEKESLPSFLWQNKWKLFCDEVAIDGSGGNAYRRYKIDKTNGAIAVIRPDGYVAQVTHVSALGVKEIDDYFANILVPYT
ncbi:unnamed protein product [Rotaria magnacalcarata]|uniref:Phenol 2-monooxygenase n=1 Tax=Rotaria magnacalcarata TaxID=392030 RepID=A0A816Y7M7_9BILA|nr:unnamed protein product [Rotaria magnacalcarata]